MLFSVWHGSSHFSGGFHGLFFTRYPYWSRRKGNQFTEAFLEGFVKKTHFQVKFSKSLLYDDPCHTLNVILSSIPFSVEGIERRLSKWPHLLIFSPIERKPSPWNRKNLRFFIQNRLIVTPYFHQVKRNQLRCSS